MFYYNEEYFHILPQNLIQHWFKHFVEKKLSTF